MSEERMNFTACDEMVAAFEKVIATPVTHKSSVYYTGVDLGTACVVIAVLDENKQPIAGAMRYADVVRDGMVVDYIGAVQIVRELKEEIEAKLGVELVYAAGAIPPGTDTLDGGAVKNVIEGAGFECTNLLDESTAANLVLQMKNGAVVDIGGTHFSLVIAGAYGKSFADAELYKRDDAHHKELMPVVRPVIDKVATIINRHIEGHDVDAIALVGGTCCFTGIEAVIEKRTGVPTHKPKNPMFVTPLGIALSCKPEAIEE